MKTGCTVCVSQGRETQGLAIATFSAYNLRSLFRRPCCNHGRDIHRLLTAAVPRTRSLRNEPGVDCALLSALGTPRYLFLPLAMLPFSLLVDPRDLAYCNKAR